MIITRTTVLVGEANSKYSDLVSQMNYLSFSVCHIFSTFKVEILTNNVSN